MIAFESKVDLVVNQVISRNDLIADILNRVPTLRQGPLGAAAWIFDVLLSGPTHWNSVIREQYDDLLTLLENELTMLLADANGINERFTRMDKLQQSVTTHLLGNESPNNATRSGIAKWLLPRDSSTKTSNMKKLLEQNDRLSASLRKSDFHLEKLRTIANEVESRLADLQDIQRDLLARRVDLTADLGLQIDLIHETIAKLKASKAIAESEQEVQREESIAHFKAAGEAFKAYVAASGA